MFSDLVDILRTHPEIALFAVLALGYAFGQIRFGPIQLGGVCGTLIVALLVGQLGITLADSVKNTFFMLFIFALGYAGGPQFFANLDAKGLRMGLLCLIEVVVVIGLVVGATILFGFDQGTAAGLMAGAATESAVVGTATDAISKLALPPDEIRQLQANVVTAYSITYVFGLIAIVVATSQVFPLLLRVNLREEADKLWRAMGGGDDDGALPAAPDMVGRVFEVTTAQGRTVAELMDPFKRRAGIERVKRGDTLPDVTSSLRLEAGDQVLVIGQRGAMVDIAGLLGREFADTTSFDVVVENVEAMLTQRDWIGRELRDLKADRTGALGPLPRLPQNVHVVGVVRDGHAMPLLPELKLQRRDVLKLYGPAADMAKVVPLFGVRVVHSVRSNISYMAAGILLGVFIGGFSIKLGGIPFSLGTGGGALLTGLAFGWYQARNPHRLSIPEDALALMKDIGLATFIACVGLASGPQALTLIRKFGVALPLLGIAIAIVPATLSLFVGRRVLKIETPVLLGAIAGQQCSTPALSAVQNVAGNTTPLLGYTITYAISNVILPLMGPLIVGIVGALQMK
ncbi:aspartate-alanine antiporter [Variovorax sp. J22R24]|uniref:aspartate-alanine antiporter n=1 Tax=Variovorax gracilis TaxID=3053502 RepID=UPI0025769E37|nr:aspartate-alanine antiporter [Variovorax sp. J22R24]MDM0105547.1 aspartate-alanine antiporter [Variovorax sp. J22R24]